MEPIGSETVVVTPEPQTDAHGDPIPGTGTPDTIRWCSVSPRTSAEDENRAATVLDKLTLLAPCHESRIPPTATVRWRGIDYKVEGRALPWVHLDGEDAGVQVNLERATG